jgi:RNA polymerase sigma factor (sigma-70 family)
MALWRLASGVPSPGSGIVSWPVEQLVEDHGLYRAYLRERAGDQAAAREFTAYWRRYIVGFSDSRWPRELTDELASRFFERTWRLVGANFTWSSPFSVYLKTVVLNLARDLRARLAVERERETSLDRDDDDRARLPRPAFRSPETEVLRNEQSEAVRRALADLAPADRHLILCCFVDGMSGNDVAKMLGVGRNALYQRLHRAKEKLRARLEDGDLFGAAPGSSRVRSRASAGPSGPGSDRERDNGTGSVKGRHVGVERPG